MANVISMNVDTKSPLAGQSTKVLVTGGAGFVGSNLCKKLLNEGHEVYAVDNVVTGHVENIRPLLENERFHFHRMDITQNEFRESFSEIPISEIYHLACPTGVPNIKILAMEMLETCSIGTQNVLEVARAHNASLVFSSSCEVYGQPEVFPQRPDYNGNVDPIGPRCPYEEGKRFSEALLITYVRKYDLNAKIVRIFNTYGPGMSLEDQRVIPQFIKSIQQGKELCVYGDGSQSRTFLYVDDLLRGLNLVMEKGEKGNVYNVGGTSAITIRELAQKMITMMGHDKDIAFTPHFIEDHNRREPATDEVCALGWKQEIGLDEGLRHMITSYEKSPEYDVTIKQAVVK